MSDMQDTQEDAPGAGFLNYLPTILWQRRWLVIIPFILLGAAGAAAAYLMPAVYRSTATLLVESQDLPTAIVASPETTLIDQRIAKIRAQVLSRGNLIELIQQNNLYADERESKPLSTVINKMRAATSIEAVSANIGQGTDRSNTIAFAMSFDYHEAAPAQLVVQEYVRHFLDLDSTQMAEQARSTVAFLKGQATDLQQQTAGIEAQIMAIKAQNGLTLTGTGYPAMTNSASYDAQIAALQRDNALLERQAASGGGKDPVVAAAEGQLAAARSIYSESHPDVRLARQKLEEAKRLAGPGEDRSFMVRSQIQANNAQIAALERARSTDTAQVAAARGAQAQAPVLMERISQLESRADALRAQHNAAAQQLLAAETAARMEEEQKGERLSLIEAPVVADEPTSPNRPMFILGGLAAGLAAGLVLALAVELVLRPIRGASQVESFMGAAPLGVVPIFEERAKRRSRRSALKQRLTPWRRAA